MIVVHSGTGSDTFDYVVAFDSLILEHEFHSEVNVQPKKTLGAHRTGQTGSCVPGGTEGLALVVLVVENRAACGIAFNSPYPEAYVCTRSLYAGLVA